MSECLNRADEFKRTKKGHRPASMPLNETHFLSYKPNVNKGGCGAKGWGSALGGEGGIGQGGAPNGCIGGARKAGDEQPAAFAFRALLVLALRRFSHCSLIFFNSRGRLGRAVRVLVGGRNRGRSRRRLRFRHGGRRRVWARAACRRLWLRARRLRLL